MKNPFGSATGAVAAACLTLCASLPVSAQTAALAPDAAASGASERASREGDKVFKWILMHSDKPRKVAKEAPVAAAAPAPAVKEVAARVETRTVAAPVEVPRSVARAESRLAAAAAPADKSALAAASAPPVAAAAPAPDASTVASALPSMPAPLPDIPAPAEDDYEEPLMLAKQVDPEFPGGVMRTLRKGTVQVKFMVQVDGSVDTVEIVKTTSVRLNSAAAAAVAQWRFMPLRHAQSGIVELGFNLD